MTLNLQAAIDDMFKPPSRLQKMVDRAVGVDRNEADLALNLDICELVNSKKGNYPHDAVFALLPYINGRSNKQAQLSLTLLDNLVKNCGHPVHYQVASREFLNELFRRFPEFQPSMPNPLHYRILELLQEWRVTLCRRSRYKDDLQRINDMYSLLRRKGWRFPELESENVAVVLGPEDTLKSREELEREDLEAMQAKLQELLRRATPRDLREANKLMKIITGYEQSSKRPDYDKEWETELQGIEAKVVLLTEILQSAEPGVRLDDTAQQLLAKCMSSQSRLQKLIAESDGQADDNNAEDSEEKRELARLIRLNDLIGDAVQAYRDLERGKTPEFRNMDAASAVAGAQSDENELIAWDDEPASDTSAGQTQQQSGAAKNPLDDLAGLDFDSNASAAARVSSPMSGIALPMSPGMNTPGLSMSIAGGGFTLAPAARAQPMSNPSLPATSQQARLGKSIAGSAAGLGQKKDVFDFSDMLSAAKTASQRPALLPEVGDSSGGARPNAPRTPSWGSSPDPDNKTQGGSLIDFLS
ncbi:ARF-binding protein [Coemansia aciculifera]|uniref:ARF-binding protein n=1 Tax=Coemansia aciculifera TaxID=417176 RepID=A0A9W8IRV1_9FUNG|nr:ARF-binding protein [Coemansia aciculifera]